MSEDDQIQLRRLNLHYNGPDPLPKHTLSNEFHQQLAEILTQEAFRSVEMNHLEYPQCYQDSLAKLREWQTVTCDRFSSWGGYRDALQKCKMIDELAREQHQAHSLPATTLLPLIAVRSVRDVVGGDDDKVGSFIIKHNLVGLAATAIKNYGQFKDQIFPVEGTLNTPPKGSSVTDDVEDDNNNNNNNDDDDDDDEAYKEDGVEPTVVRPRSDIVKVEEPVFTPANLIETIRQTHTSRYKRAISPPTTIEEDTTIVFKREDVLAECRGLIELIDSGDWTNETKDVVQQTLNQQKVSVLPLKDKMCLRLYAKREKLPEVVGWVDTARKHDQKRR
ncbi:hypothetical protein PT974_09687 [Cladobotryum mycophilum]|uniref:Uncharacterized protein n=1 Tax=Cladobotryum mycophilum TaxID=491253 RepID=A0ABR0SGY1_9HYPO